MTRHRSPVRLRGEDQHPRIATAARVRERAVFGFRSLRTRERRSTANSHLRRRRDGREHCKVTADVAASGSRDIDKALGHERIGRLTRLRRKKQQPSCSILFAGSGELPEDKATRARDPPILPCYAALVTGMTSTPMRQSGQLIPRSGRDPMVQVLAAHHLPPQTAPHMRDCLVTDNASCSHDPGGCH